MASDFGIVVNSDDELVAEGLCLAECVCVTEVHHVVAKSRTGMLINWLLLNFDLRKFCYIFFKANLICGSQLNAILILCKFLTLWRALENIYFCCAVKFRGHHVALQLALFIPNKALDFCL